MAKIWLQQNGQVQESMLFEYTIYLLINSSLEEI